MSYFYKFLPVLNISQTCSLFFISTTSTLLRATLITCLDEKCAILLASSLVAFFTNHPFYGSQSKLLRNKHLVFTHGYEILSSVAPDWFPICSFTTLLPLYNPVPLVSRFLKTVQFMSAQSLCTFSALLETFVQPHYMLSRAPLPLRVTTPFLQTSAHTSLYEKAFIDPLQSLLVPLLPCSRSLFFF